eukprot:Filipodium_phascolosomae@DN324_c0_g1_i1.p1
MAAAVGGTTTVTSSKQKSTALIQRLLAAEKEAEEVLSQARENRAKKLLEARESADAELRLYRQEQEAALEASNQQGGMDYLTSDLEGTAQQSMEEMKERYQQHGSKVVAWIVKSALETNMTLPDIAKWQLQATNQDAE